MFLEMVALGQIDRIHTDFSNRIGKIRFNNKLNILTSQIF